MPHFAALLATAALSSTPGLPSTRIAGVPHVTQKPDFCGEAAVAMWFGKLGHAVDQDAVFDRTGVDPALGRGAWTAELARGVRALGFDPGPVWSKISATAPAPGLDAAFRALHADLARGVPSIVCTRYDGTPDATEHFRLVLGYDARRDEVLYHEPAIDGAAYQRMDRATFLSLWPLKYGADEWTLVRLALDGTPKVPTAPAGLTDADYAQAVLDVRAKAPEGRNFSWVIEPPFVVAGDAGVAEVRRWATGTVRWAVTKLKKRYFQRDPDRVLQVWLFRDTASYERHTREIFGHEPSTPYGYYSSEAGALVMNIATGGGTLVHEIVHPYVEANFPAARAWVNEGLGSLYEQSSERDGGIIGLTNWRLAGLQEAIAAGSLPSLKTLAHTSDHDFYEADPGTNYGQARYLMLYLQERDLLETFWRTYRRDQAKDPTGWRSLLATLGKSEKQMPALQRTWEAWVAKLTFP